MFTVLLLITVAAAFPHSQQASPTLARRKLNLANKPDDYWELERRSASPFTMGEKPMVALVARDEVERSKNLAVAFAKLKRRHLARRDSERPQNIPTPTFRLSRRANNYN